MAINVLTMIRNCARLLEVLHLFYFYLCVFDTFEFYSEKNIYASVQIEKNITTDYFYSFPNELEYIKLSELAEKSFLQTKW